MRLFGFGNAPRAPQTTPKSSWSTPRRGFDTVVFVHGILGSHATTWGEFEQLLRDDEELPELDILSWGYKSGLVPSHYADVETEGAALASTLETGVKPGGDIFLLGHSMGGLVILKGLVDRILLGHGKVYPVSNVRWITLYATPLFGSAVANVVAFALSLSRWTRVPLKFLPGTQLSKLRRGDFCDRLTSDVVRLIYKPDPNTSFVMRKISVRACPAKHDALVSLTSATGVFTDPAPVHLEANHGTVKLPADREDPRYLAFKVDLEACLRDSLAALCRQARDATQPAQRRAAAQRFDAQYGRMLERCVQACFGGRNVTDQDRAEVCVAIWRVGAEGRLTPAQVISQVISDYKYGADLRFKLPTL